LNERFEQHIRCVKPTLMESVLRLTVYSGVLGDEVIDKLKVFEIFLHDERSLLVYYNLASSKE
jgi:hypothetical protein